MAGTAAIYWVIDPKLRAVSREYEARQARYVEQLEQRLQELSGLDIPVQFERNQERYQFLKWGQSAFEKEVFESHLLYRAFRRQDRAVQVAILSRLSPRRPGGRAPDRQHRG